MSWPGLTSALQGRRGTGEVGGKKVCRRNSARGYSHSIGTWGCLLLASVHPRRYFSFSLFLNAQHWTFHLLSGQDLTRVLFAACVLGLPTFASYATLLADRSGLPWALSFTLKL